MATIVSGDHRHLHAHSRGSVGVARAIEASILAIAAPRGVGAAATSAARGGAHPLGRGSAHSGGGSLSP